MNVCDHTYSLVIRETHLDFFGHVNNAMYLVLYEEARWDWITRNGYGAEVIRETGLGPVILDVHVQFKRELTLRDEIIVNSRLIEYPEKIGKIEQSILKADGEVSSTAIFTVALLDMHKRKIVPPTSRWRNALQAIPRQEES